jgi:putative phosphoesterase
VVRIAIVSDTHLPRGDRRLSGACVARLRAADLILHAGDLVTLAVLEELRSYGPTVAVHGNVDEQKVRKILPATRETDIQGLRIGLIHDAGPRTARLQRMRARFPQANAVVFGHSHIPLHERAEDGFQIFNPGSPTDRRRQPVHTMGLARINRGRLSFELIALD